MTSRWKLSVLVLASSFGACSDLCPNGQQQACTDVLTIVFEEPLRFEGTYSLEISGATSSSCSFVHPATTAADCSNNLPIVENGAVAGLRVSGPLNGAVTLAVSVDDEQLLSERLLPEYRRPGDDCGHACRYASVRIETAGLALPSGGEGAGGEGGRGEGAGAGGSPL